MMIEDVCHVTPQTHTHKRTVGSKITQSDGDITSPINPGMWLCRVTIKSLREARDRSTSCPTRAHGSSCHLGKNAQIHRDWDFRGLRVTHTRVCITQRLTQFIYSVYVTMKNRVEVAQGGGAKNSNLHTRCLPRPEETTDHDQDRTCRHTTSKPSTLPTEQDVE